MPKARPPEDRLECEELGNPTLLDGCRPFHLVQPASTHKTIALQKTYKQGFEANPGGRTRSRSSETGARV